MKITSALNRIYRWLEVNKSEFADAFQNGLSYQEIQSKFIEINLLPTEEICELYQWKNGVNENTFINTAVFASGDFLPLSIALERYQDIKNSNMICDDLFILEWVSSIQNKSLFPFYDIDGYRYTVILNLEKTVDSPVVRISCDGEFSLAYQNLTAMFLTIAECYEDGAYYIGDDEEHCDIIVENPKKVSKILKKHNPLILERAIVNLTSIIGSGKENLDEYNYREYIYSTFNNLRRFRETGVKEVLINYLNHLNSIPRTERIEYVISEVIYTLGFIDDLKVIPYILIALTDQSTIIKYQAQRAAVEQGIEIE